VSYTLSIEQHLLQSILSIDILSKANAFIVIRSLQIAQDQSISSLDLSMLLDILTTLSKVLATINEFIYCSADACLVL
jgi:hypothetical protein